MQQGTLCPRCGRAMRYIPEYQNWYCDTCGAYPYQQPVSMAFPPPTKSDPIKLILIIVVIIPLIIIISFIIISVMYVMFSGMETSTSTTPTGGLNFMKESQGNYTGGFTYLSETVDLTDVSITVIDDDLGTSNSVDLTDTGGTVEVSGGLRLEYTDTYDNDKVDCGDVIKIYNVDNGDIIKFVYEPTGDTIEDYTL